MRLARHHRIAGSVSSNRHRLYLLDRSYGIEPLESRWLLAAVPSLLSDIAAGAFSSNPTEPTEVNGTFFFVADDRVHGKELWKTDGTSAGTVLVKDIRPGAQSSSVGGLRNIGGTLYFSGNDGDSSHGLWKSDGTEAGTLLVKATGSADEITSVNETHFFFANGAGLWLSDGTEAGTVFVKEFELRSQTRGIKKLMNINGTLFFEGCDLTHGYELWKSDGTTAGTTLVKDIDLGSSESNLRDMTNVNGMLYFTADDGTTADRELWKSDGTTAGTVMVKDIAPPLNYGPDNLVNVNGVLYFSATNGLHQPNTNGRELWTTDGTTAGTKMVKDIYYVPPGTYSSSPTGLTNVNGTLFFAATTFPNDRELWKSDGTELGTVRVKDIRPGTTASSNPVFFYNAAGIACFLTNDGNFELWETDGTASGTRMISDFNMFGTGGSNIGFGYRWYRDGILYFAATHSSYGNELWKMEPTRKPVLGPIGNQSIGEGPWSIVVSAHDENPSDTLTFSLGPGSPAGLTIAPGPGARQATLSWTPGENDSVSPNPATISVIVTDNSSDLWSDSETLQLTVTNTPPSAMISGPALLEALEAASFNLTALDPSPADQAAGFTFDIDWDGNGTFDETVVGPSGTTVGHSFATAGVSNSVRVRATDVDGGVGSSSTHTVHVYSLSQTAGVLDFQGTGGNDIVAFTELGPGTIDVAITQLGGIAASILGNFTGITQVVAKTHAGNDQIDASQLTSINATLEGGRHSDTITGGGANDILRGEFVGAAGDGAEGKDSIIGGAGNDLIEGDGLEGGKDTLRGGAGEDTIYGDGGDGLEGRADSIFGDDGIDVLYGNHGHDYIEAGNGEFNYLSGGDGAESNDTLVGGAGADLLSGQSGNDSLIGGGELDVLLGGDGADTLTGGDSEDILVADTTNFDFSLMTTAFEILDEWWGGAVGEGRGYAERIAKLTGEAGGFNDGVYLVPGTTVFDDEDADVLTGGATDFDWYVYNLLQDVLNDHAPGETEADTAGFLLP